MMEVGDEMMQTNERRHEVILFHHFRRAASLNPAGIADDFGEPGAFFMPGSIALHLRKCHW